VKTLQVTVVLIAFWALGVLGQEQLISTTVHNQSEDLLAKHELIRTGIVRGLIWQLCWNNGKSDKAIRRELTKPLRYTLATGDHSSLLVYVDLYHWKITLAPFGNSYIVAAVEDYAGLTWGNEQKAVERYLHSKGSDPNTLTNGFLTVRAADFDVIKFISPADPRYSSLTNTLVQHFLKTEKFEVLARKANLANMPDRITVHLSGLTSESPWVYYYFDQIPYLGMILLDYSDLSISHDELCYIHDNSNEKQLRLTMSAIRHRGTRFSINRRSIGSQ
jgi:hypothetical protein